MPSYRKDRETWQGQVYRDHRYYRKSGFQTKREARQWEVDKERELKVQEKEKKKKTQTGMDILHLCNQYIDEARLRYVKKTWQEKDTLNRRLLEEFGSDMSIAEITSDDINRYLNVQAETRSRNAANKDRKNLMAMFEYAKKFCGLSRNPVVEIAKFPHDRSIQYTPSRADVLKVLAAATAEEKVFLQVYLHTAARRSEIFRLTWGDVDFAAGRVRLGTRKTKDGSMKYRYVSMSDTLFNTLQWWWKHRSVTDTPFVFVSTGNRHYGKPFVVRRRFMKGLCKRAEVKEFGFHAIRRHVPSFLADQGVPMKILQELLGHEQLRTTEIYMANVGVGLEAYVNLLDGDGAIEMQERKGSTENEW